MKNKVVKQTQNHYAKNMQSIDFENNKERKGQPNFYPSVINTCGATLANDIKNYIKKGGDINNLTPENVFKK